MSLYVKEIFKNRIALTLFSQQRLVPTEPHRPEGHKPVTYTE
jgi:hypothetical protein